MVSYQNEKPTLGLEEFVEDFLNDRLKEFDSLKLFLINKDYENLKRIAHKWKGFCSPYGFNHLESLSSSLEKCAIKKEFSKSQKICLEIDEYLAIKQQAIKGLSN